MWKQGRNTFNRTMTMKFSKVIVTPATGLRQNERWTHSTIDVSDVKHFSKLYNDWWDIKGPMRLLHAMNAVRTPLIRDRFVIGKTIEDMKLPLKNQKILDVGCGGGILSEDLAKLGAEVTGIDASRELIEVGQAHKEINPEIANKKPIYYNTTIEEHANDYKNHYDSVIASEIIEHVNNPTVFVKSCVDAVKPGGKILFTTPNRTRTSQFVIIFLCEDVLNLLPKGTHQYEKFITPNELTAMLEKNSCSVEYSSGMWLSLMSKTWKATNSMQIVYVLQASKSKSTGTD